MVFGFDDQLPLDDIHRDATRYSRPEYIGGKALVASQWLLAQDGLNYDATEMHMRASAGLFNGAGNLDNPSYNRLPSDARQAMQRIADTSFQYLAALGLADDIIEDKLKIFPEGLSDYDQDGMFVNAMQLHVSMVGRQEERRRMSVFYGGKLPAGMAVSKFLTGSYPKENPQDAEQQRAEATVPYSERGIRKVLEVFGENLEPIIVGLYETMPLPADNNRRSLLSHANSSIKASMPHSR